MGTYFEHLHGPLLTRTLLDIADADTEIVLAHVHRRDELARWRARFEKHFSIEILSVEEETPCLDEEDGMRSGDEIQYLKRIPQGFGEDDESLEIRVLRMRLKTPQETHE